MRKWLWDVLRKKTCLKLKVAWMADTHAKYYKRRTIPSILRTPFKTLWEDVMRGQVHPDYEKFIAGQQPKDELVDFTLMKVEDTFSWDAEEPWMKAVDATKSKEQRVMFDTDSFWKEGGDESLERIRRHCGLIPKQGYHTCPAFARAQEKSFGAKRYVLLKPDNTRSKVEVAVKMKHVLPLMRYTFGFKCNVAFEQLDLPLRDDFFLVLSKAKENEIESYSIERFTTLVSIIVLSSRPDGITCALLFLFTRGVVYAQSFRLDWLDKLSTYDGEYEGCRKYMAVTSNTFWGTDMFIKFLQM
jgi:hypothetical protein